MTLPDIDTVLEWRGRTIVDQAGQKIGKFQEIYLDAETDRPEWAAVSTGLLGRRQSLVPLSEAQATGDEVRVPFDKEHVKNAPNVDADGELSQREEGRLYSHYGLDYSKGESETGLPGGAGEERVRGGAAESAQGEAAPAGDQGAPGDAAREARPGGAPGAGAGAPQAADLAREGGAPSRTAGGPARGAGGETGPGAGGSAEEVVEDIGTETAPRERVRLKKYVVTEEVTKRVPVTREEVRVEREPVDRPPDEQQ